MSEFMAYIDEAGDEGIGRGTRWFILTAVMVEDGSDSSHLGEVLKTVKAQIGLMTPVLHWTALSHIRRVAVCKHLALAPVTICAVLVDTYHPSLQQAALKSGRLYFYAFRWLVERVTWFCRDKGATVRLRPENKAGISYENLKSYLETVQKMPDCQISPNRILDVKPRGKHDLAALQVADAAAGALWAAFEPHPKTGVTDESYLIMWLKHKLYRRNGRLWGYGMKFMPHAAAHVPSVLVPSYDWLDQL